MARRFGEHPVQLHIVEHAGVAPDLLTCGKGVTGGYLPLSAVLATSSLLVQETNIKCTQYTTAFVSKAMTTFVTKATTTFVTKATTTFVTKATMTVVT